MWSWSAAAAAGEQLAARYAADAAQRSELSDVQKRIARRQSYMDQVEQRNDSGLGLLLIAAFAGPAAIILAIAFGSGYMDDLYLRSLTSR